jgi:hypothetical protein
MISRNEESYYQGVVAGLKDALEMLEDIHKKINDSDILFKTEANILLNRIEMSLMNLIEKARK